MGAHLLKKALQISIGTAPEQSSPYQQILSTGERPVFQTGNEMKAVRAGGDLAAGSYVQEQTAGRLRRAADEAGLIVPQRNRHRRARRQPNSFSQLAAQTSHHIPGAPHRREESLR